MTPTSVTVSAPLRLSLGGGGCDLPEFYRTHGADVLSVAIDRRLSLTIERSDEPTDTDVRVGLLAARLPWPIQATVDCLVPPGSGLGGSGAFTVALVAAGRVFDGAIGLDPLDIGSEAYRWERVLLGEPVGFQDQMASAFGSLTRMSVHADRPRYPGENDRIRVERQDRLAGSLDKMLGDSVRMFATRQVRSAARRLTTFAKNLAADDGAISLADTPAFVDTITRCDGTEFGRLMRRRWERKVALNPAAAWPEVTAAIEDALAAGATGAKVVGAGGGGWLMVAGPSAVMPAVADALTHRHALSEDTFHVESTGILVERIETT